MDTVLALLRGSRWQLAGAVASGAASGLGIAGLIALINTALATPREQLPPLLAAFAGLCLLIFVTRTLSETLLVRLSQQVITALRSELSRQILASPLRRLEAQGTHRLLAALTDDVQKIAALLTRLPTFCINTAVALGCFAYMGWLSWPLMLAALACVGLAVGGFCLAQRRAQESLGLSRQAGDELYKHFNAVTQGTKELQLHQGRRQSFLSGRLDATLARLQHHFVAGMSLYARAESVALLVFFVFIGLLIFLPASLTTDNPAVLTGYALTFLYLITPIEVLVNTAPDFGHFRIALKTLAELQLGLATTRPPAAAAALPAPLRDIALCGVTHSYRSEHEDGSFLLGPIDLRLQAGETVFITGGNGSGKTTLAKLIVGLYTPDNGLMRVNGQAVEGEAGEAAYRQLFSTVFSDFFLFDELPGLDTPERRQRAQELLALLKLEHKLTLDQGRFSTTALSQGQRKRLALLGAVLEDRPVYLFDEWAADQDPVFKRIFYTRILPMLKARGKLVIAITHDDAYFHLADRHVRLESGQVAGVSLSSITPVESGAPAEQRRQVAARADREAREEADACPSAPLRGAARPDGEGTGARQVQAPSSRASVSMN